ncbi:MAG: hypothetical protein WAL85_04590, partial [Candidatus Korobacteraceae bacterium]
PESLVTGYDLSRADKILFMSSLGGLQADEGSASSTFSAACQSPAQIQSKTMYSMSFRNH